MSFFFPSSPSTSDATVSSLASSPRLGGGASELATPTHVSESTSPRSPITATSTTRAPESRVSGSPKAVGLKVIQNSNDSNNDHNGNGNGHYYGDNELPLSRATSDVYEPAAPHTRRDRDRGDDHPHGLSELSANLERGVDRLLRMMVAGEFSESESSLSSLDDESVVSGRTARKGKSRESERVVEDVDTSNTRTHRAIGDVGTHSTRAVPHAARASGSSALQGTSISRPLISPPIPPADDAQARSHRRRSSGDPSRPVSTHTHRRRSSRRLVVHKRQEVGICKSLTLCFSFMSFFGEIPF